ncbi:stage II sporulation protein M [Fulvivirga sp. M361]|uniref:stage II sporulation protein M n=1 Tax=Fulvivirga sp. M361 TaxID=2594266 RepID=UPI00117B026B|nr:stage II sporulation protein M [Fulvivirga sp. M361]TRX61224.1 stage II sporulation protein M [Fulvivirga sp. M361]
MKEAAFVKQNLQRWQEFEKSLEKENTLGPDQLAEIFIQITDDLSFSRTQYPKSDTTRYLNNLASGVHLEIYKNKKEDKNRFITFWKHELPFLFKSAHRQLAYAFIIFSLAAAMGVISVVNDENFVRLILGDGYVNMTLDNIEKGNPLGVYGKTNEADMFFGITFNNIKVSFTAFAAGLLISIGTGFLLFYNGLMVGTFFTFLAQKGFLADSLLIVMLHGTLELSAIILAGAAGFVMGNSILFPGTYSRLASFKKGAKKGLKIVMGLMPVFIIAGFIESFITRYTFMHWSVKLAVVALSAFFIIYYFIFYPIKLHKDERKP